MMASALSRRIGFVALAITVLTAAIYGDAFANAGKRHRHALGPATESRERESTDGGQLVSQQATRHGPMRYYGGPKSPMWRGPVEN